MSTIDEATIDDATIVAVSADAGKPPGVLRRGFRLTRSRIGAALVAIVLLFAFVGPSFAPHSETGYVGSPNSRTFEGTLFGTDYQGQDIWSRFLIGGKSILLYAAAATIIGLVLGVTIGLFAALNRGKLDELLMRSIDIILAFPQLLLVLVAITTIGPKPWLMIATIGLTTAPRIARVTRGAALQVVERDFVLAAEALGESKWRIIRSELLPNVSAPLLVEANLRLTYSIGSIAGLAFLGFSANPGKANWGQMIQENRLGVTVQPWGVILPTVAIAVLTIGTGLIGDGLSLANAGSDRRKGN